MKRRLVTIAGIAVCLLLGGCSLLKKEEEYHVLRIDSLQDEQRDEKIAVVMRGDIAEETSITVLAQIAGRSALSFPITGEDFGKSYISVGDRVKKGQLLMELDCDTFRQELKQVQYEEQNILIDREECEKLFQSSMDKKPDYKESLRLKEEYQDAMEDYENRLEILRLHKAECEKKIQERCLYADIDGVVTSMQEITEGGKSVAGFTMVNLAAENYRYEATTTAEELVVGDTYPMQQQNRTVDVVLQSMEKSDEGYHLIFTLKNEAGEEDADVTVGGKIILKTKERDNVLYLEKDAVVKTEDAYYVYVNEEDDWQIKEIGVDGPVGDYYIITEGLEEGESVLCR